MSDLGNCLIYGAYGYTGELTARLAKERGLSPILAGRSEAKLKPLADELDLPAQAFSLDEPAAIDAALNGVDLVLHCAGPFSKTSRPMVDACLRTKTHYVDITGEIEVFEACAARDDEAREAGVVLLPGAGFDVVPSDCLAAFLKEKVPEATHLTLAIQWRGGGRSRGTMRSSLEGFGKPNKKRVDGEIVDARMGERRDFDFGRGPRSCLGFPWGDVSTAFYSTKIPNIEVFMAMPPKVIRSAWINGLLGPRVMQSGFMQRRLRARVDAAPPGPTAEQRAKAEIIIVGEARSSSARVRARLRAPEGYELTARTSLEVAKRVLEERPEGGFYTPSLMFGPDFILAFDGVERKLVP